VQRIFLKSGSENQFGSAHRDFRDKLKTIKIKTGVHMAVQKGDLKDRLSRYREIDLSVTGRKSGRTISQPVWFVFEDDRIYLLPVRGSDTQWYKNVLKNPAIRIDARSAESEFNAVPIRDAKQVASVVEKFRAKYGAGDVKKYYSKFDVAVVARMMQ
jgi:deazaflavin-dependent oxidoreductase (nitroreductase family)